LQPSNAAGAATNLDLLLGVTLRVTVELGRTKMSIEEILKLGPGSVVELDKLAGEPVDVLVNGRLIARGEVVVLDDRFGVRITDVVPPAQRLDTLR
jgi:flagellar motor switch protein FliN/FliY